VSACDGTAAVVVFDTATYGVIATIPIGPAAMSALRNVAVDPKGRFVYAGAYGESLVVIDAGTNEIASSIPVACCFGSITVSPDGLRAYLAGSAFFTDFVDVITLPGGEPLGSVTFEFESIGRRVATTADGTTAFVGVTECLLDLCEGTIAVIDTQALTVTASIPALAYPDAIALTPDATALYALHPFASLVTVIDPETLVVRTTIPAPEPQSIEIGVAPE
jgi:DNA-binding beta-propeller fold protein YncE